MHSILALASSHGRYLNPQQNKAEHIREVYHSRQCALLFKDLLNHPVRETDKDAIWATAVGLSLITFASVRVTSFKQAWPLVDVDSLQWLRLKATDKALWTLTDPTRPESAFCDSMKALSELQQPLPVVGSTGVCDRLSSLCGLTMSSNAINNPYFSFVHALSDITKVPVGYVTLGQAYRVICAITNEQIDLLEAKDPIALLLLYSWYIRARHTRWCIDLRARYEIPAIRAYLQHFHKDNAVVQAYLLAEC